MNKQEFNRLVAEFLGKVSVGFRADGVEEFLNDRGGSQPFNPYDDANDMLLLEKEIKFRTYFDAFDKRWTSEVLVKPDGRQIFVQSDGPHESRRACAEEYLKEWKTGGV